MKLRYLKPSVQGSLNGHAFGRMCPIGCDGSDQTVAKNNKQIY